MGKCGRAVCFHGAFKTKAAAEKKEASKRGAFILKRKIRRQTRFVVVTPKE